MNEKRQRKLYRTDASWLNELTPPFITSGDEELCLCDLHFFRDLETLFNQYEPWDVKDERSDIFDATGLRLQRFFVRGIPPDHDIVRVERTEESRSYLRDKLLEFFSLCNDNFYPEILRELTLEELCQWCIWLVGYSDVDGCEPIPDGYQITERDHRYWPPYRQEMIRMIKAFLSWEWLKGRWAEAAEIEGRPLNFKPKLPFPPAALFAFHHRVNSPIIYMGFDNDCSCIHEQWRKHGRDFLWEILQALERYPKLEDFFTWSQSWEPAQPPQLELLQKRSEAPFWKRFF